MGEDEHAANLLKLCRTCGKFIGKEKYRLNDEMIKRTESAFYIDFTTDSVLIHPVNICHICYCFVSNSEKKPTSRGTRTPQQWAAHLQTGCVVCHNIKILKKEADPLKNEVMVVV